MAKWLVAIGALVVALVVLLWQLSTPPESRRVLAQSSGSTTPDSTQEPEASTTSGQAKTQNLVVPRQVEKQPEAEEPEIEMLVPGTPEFGHRMDVVVGENFREALAPCYEGGLDGNLQLTITYQLHIVGGKIYATNVRVTESELNDRALEQCMVAAVEETGQRVGFITPLSHNFCESCNRVRLTCTGQLYMCLGQDDDADLRKVLRESDDDAVLEAAIREAITRKPKGHDFDYSRQKVEGQVSRHMSVTGG